jgi:ubiquitin-protein ligase
VLCWRVQVYHPNIDLSGNVCLNILRKDWSPVLTLYAVIHGLLYLFNEPEPNDPLNSGASVAVGRVRYHGAVHCSVPRCGVGVDSAAMLGDARVVSCRGAPPLR